MQFDLSKGKRVVGYCRYSSSSQRDESIDAQQRAIIAYCASKEWVLVGWYIDRARTGRNDDRKEFIRMLNDSSSGMFDIVLVHKSNRFCRGYGRVQKFRNYLQSQGVLLQSTREIMDGTPESESMLGQTFLRDQEYSDYLSEEVKKGLHENALNAKYNGGRVPYGLSVDAATQKYIVNESEAEGVRTVFRMTIEGHSYTEIQTELNRRGFRTKKGEPFGVNSLHSILKNEKYTGTYIYNRSAEATLKALDNYETRKVRNGHKYRDRSEWIIHENAFPAIVSKEDFEKVQQIMEARRRRSATYKAKREYLLSGKIVCGECGSSISGNYRKSGGGHVTDYASYRCTRKNKTIECGNKEVNCELLESKVIALISSIIYDESKIPEIVSKYEDYYRERHSTQVDDIQRLQKSLAQLDRRRRNTAAAIAEIGLSETLAEQLKQFEAEKAAVEAKLRLAEIAAASRTIDEQRMVMAFRAAKAAFESGENKTRKLIVQRLVEKVTVYSDHVEVSLNLDSELLASVLRKASETTNRTDATVSPICHHYCEDMLAEVERFELSRSF